MESNRDQVDFLQNPVQGKESTMTSQLIISSANLEGREPINKQEHLLQCLDNSNVIPDNSEAIDPETGPILHLVVVGFHHKKGCQVEYAYPPLIPGSSPESGDTPEPWRHIASLALPDGSHNYTEDTVYFHLPSLTEEGKTIFGISCYRQIDAQKLTKRTADITRSSVQKSVCVLSTIPLYGHIQVKMSLITHAYFREGDFSQVSLLQDAYHNLQSCLSQENINLSQLFVGLSARDLVVRFRHKVMQLFKLLLLEKRVLFFQSPVQPLCSSILALLSLFPGLIENGLQESTLPSRQCTPNLSPAHICNTAADTKEKRPSVPDAMTSLDDLLKLDERKDSTSLSSSESVSSLSSKLNQWKDRLSGAWDKIGSNGNVERKDSLENINTSSCEDLSFVEGKDISGYISPSKMAGLKNEECGFPLKIFNNGYLCHPYLSLSYMDSLGDTRVRGYVVGATNVLFKQKKGLFDVIVEVEAGNLEIFDPELRRILHLTTADLRFADHLLKHVSQDRHDIFLEGVGWEGGEDWVRAEMKAYLLQMLKTSLLMDSAKELEDYNIAFIQAWRCTRNYESWAESEPHPALGEVLSRHPFCGQLSVADMKLRISHSMQTTENGRKLATAAASTGKVVVQTGKAVGGALSQAKGAIANWWSTLNTAENLDIGKEVVADKEMKREPNNDAAR